MRRRPAVVVAVAVVLVAGAALVTGGILGVSAWRDAHRSDLERAVSLIPADAQRLSWTAWGAVRAELGIADEADGGLGALLDEGYDADLTASSALLESAPLLQRRFGWSPLTIEWELLSQGPEGAVDIVALPDDADAADVAALGDRLEDLGYERPDDPGGVWYGGEEVVARISGETGLPATPTLQYVALDADRGLVLISDAAAYLEAAVAAAAEEHETDLDHVAAVAAEPGEPLSGELATGEQVCSALAMGTADAGDRATADRLLEAAGEVSPISAYAMVATADRIRVAMQFETEDQARTNADTRAVLAAGPAPGQGGSFRDRFTLDRVAAEDDTVVMDLDPRPRTFVLSDLGSGPVLFLTC